MSLFCVHEVPTNNIPVEPPHKIVIRDGLGQDVLTITRDGSIRGNVDRAIETIGPYHWFRSVLLLIRKLEKKE